MASGKKERSPAQRYQVAVRAAGGVVCRTGGEGSFQVATIHRPDCGDWTLPKGKLYEGETPEQAALREVKEETGLRCQLLTSLGCIHYLDRRGRRKIACYWLMRPLAGRFQPSAEADDMRWLTPEGAEVLLTNERDKAIVRRAQAVAAEIAIGELQSVARGLA
jgi:8-oxo-dGTP diphosphatase